MVNDRVLLDGTGAATTIYVHMTIPAGTQRHRRNPLRLRRHALAIGVFAVSGIVAVLAASPRGSADDRCSTSPVFDLPAQLATPDGLRENEGAHLVGRWPVDEGMLELWLIAADGKISDAFLTLSRRQLKRASGALPKDVTSCIKVMAASGAAGRSASLSSLLVARAWAATAEGSYRAIRSCVAPATKGGSRMCYYALERRENNVWKGLTVFMTAVGG
ncbi:MAG: hypothetical protein U1F33_15900 [Alphaproteobacteria bacterium]